ncbi:MAG: flagellin, partial [Phycisphaeraceae bacterium]|nr:flagellin [Phycisphaeraceae bacterium]
MSRINTNVTSLIGQRVLRTQNTALNKSLERLSTGLAINRGSDNPAGLIASENLRSEKAAIASAISNAERADQVINIAEGGLQEVNSLLLQVQSLVGESANDAGLSKEEKSANQLQIDSILQTIDRIASATSFQGVKLLNGTFDFNISAQATTVNAFQINAAKLGHGETRDVQVIVTASAQHASIFLSTNGPLDLSASDAQFTFELAGSKGSRVFSFASGTTLSSI